jgi:hypothetical protein
MKLADKGRYAAPPKLPKRAQRVSEALATWPRVHARTHWQLGDESIVDGADFYVGQGPLAAELGHLHLDGQAHVAMPATLASALIAARLAQRFPYGRGFVVFDVDSEAAVDHALWLFRLNYDFCAAQSRKSYSGASKSERAKR